MVEVKCFDNGPGFPPEAFLEEKHSLGLEIIEGLTEQVDGTLSIYNEDGAVYCFSVKT
jgi:two-component sensor histidine kinase